MAVAAANRGISKERIPVVLVISQIWTLMPCKAFFPSLQDLWTRGTCVLSKGNLGVAFFYQQEFV